MSGQNEQREQSKAQRLNQNLARIQSPPTIPLFSSEHKPYYTREDVEVLRANIQHYRLLSDEQYANERMNELAAGIATLQREIRKIESDRLIAAERVEFLVNKLLIVEEEVKENELSVKRVKADGDNKASKKKATAKPADSNKPSKEQQQNVWLLGLLKQNGMDVSQLEKQLGVKA